MNACVCLLVLRSVVSADLHAIAFEADGKDHEPARVVTLTKHATIDRGRDLEVPSDAPAVPDGNVIVDRVHDRRRREMSAKTIQ